MITTMAGCTPQNIIYSYGRSNLICDVEVSSCIIITELDRENPDSLYRHVNGAVSYGAKIASSRVLAEQRA